MPTVSLISTQLFDILEFEKIVEEELGLQPIKTLDDKKVDISRPEAFLNILSVLVSFSEGDWRILSHYYFTFVITGLDEEVFVGLKVLRKASLFVVSGNLSEWLQCAKLHCHKESTKELRLIFNKIFWLVERAGIRLRLKKETLSDGTWGFYLN